MSVPHPPETHNPPASATPQAGRLDGPDPRAWLAQFPDQRRSTIATWFHGAVRTGAQTPHAVCSAVWQTVQRRLQGASELASRQFLQGVLDILQRTPQEALAYAQSVLDYERLPYHERQQMKARRAFAYLKAGMQDKPATEAQHGLLRRLGYEGALPQDRAAASELIDPASFIPLF